MLLTCNLRNRLFIRYNKNPPIKSILKGSINTQKLNDCILFSTYNEEVYQKCLFARIKQNKNCFIFVYNLIFVHYIFSDVGSSLIGFVRCNNMSMQNTI